MINFTCAHCGKDIDIVGKGKIIIADGVPWHKVCYDDQSKWKKIYMDMIRGPRI